MAKAVKTTHTQKLPLSFIPARELTSSSKADVMAEIIKFTALEGPMRLGDLRDYIRELFDGNEPTLSPIVFEAVYALIRTGTLTTDEDMSGDTVCITDDWNLSINSRLYRFICGNEPEAEAD
ncbi:hypothetical protein NOJ28_11440 [Neorhizobium galegae]|uniref:hypothetical protein n=1 Tax=Neorhizobium galegae TaxID=399 RepID=UPI002106E907|nr:hypothetical protein [Neorhizobium galegae]MCQ1766149.1 hypothetical protein [Neorhizobium galegae]MCQ1845063.1 hypothetical protein [Neorhizobium galegae]